MKWTTKAVTKNANELAKANYNVPEFDRTARRLLLNQPTDPITSVQNCVLLCTGTLPWITSMRNSIIIVDGDVVGATGIDNCLLVVSGKLGRFTGIRDSIILVKGEFGVKEAFGNADELRGATVCQASFIQAKNGKIRFTSCEDSVFVKTVPTPGRNNRVLDGEKNPLTLLKFSEHKTLPDEKLSWGKESNGLAVAITPGVRPDSFLVRWKNVGKDTLELRAVRTVFEVAPREEDDLRNHVLVKGSEGNLLPATKPRFPPRKVGAPQRSASVTLEPGKTHEEAIDLGVYVQRPNTPGQYDLSIELDVAEALAPLEKGARYWTGKVTSNTLKITFGK
jgi:hypothetical protein